MLGKHFVGYQFQNALLSQFSDINVNLSCIWTRVFAHNHVVSFQLMMIGFWIRTLTKSRSCLNQNKASVYHDYIFTLNLRHTYAKANSADQHQAALKQLMKSDQGLHCLLFHLHLYI